MTSRRYPARAIAAGLAVVLTADLVAAAVAVHGSLSRFLLIAFPAVALPWLALAGLAGAHQSSRTRLHRRSRQLTGSEERFRLVAAASEIAVLETDRHGMLAKPSARLATLLDRPASAISGLRWLDCFSPAETGALRAALESPSAGAHGDLRLIPRADADLAAPAVWLRWHCWSAPRQRGTAPGAGHRRRILTLADVTAEISATAAPGLDPVTGLPDRASVLHLLTELRPGLRNGGYYGVVVLRINGLAEIRREEGQQVGDALLCCAVEAIELALRDEDDVTRLRGDELAIVVRSLTAGRTGTADNHLDPERRLAAACATLEGLSARLSAAVSGVDDAGPITASVGAVLVTDPTSEPERILADACRSAEQGGFPEPPTTVGPHSIRAAGAAALAPRVPARPGLVTEREFALALDDEQLRLVFQPVLDLRTGEVVAAEALVRWQHPEHGLLLPGQFLPLAERTGLVIEMGTWVLREALAALSAWPTRTRVAVNMSAQQLGHLHHHGGLAHFLADAAIPAERLCIEVLETHLLDADSLRAVGVMSGLGVHVAMDDLGAGYSSLLSLKDVPVDLMKVDRAFVADLGRRDSAGAIIRALVALGHDLAASVVAEGIETRAQAELLVAAGCDLGQGFLWSAGVNAVDIAEMMEQSPWEAPVPGLPPGRRHHWSAQNAVPAPRLGFPLI